MNDVSWKPRKVVTCYVLRWGARGSYWGMVLALLIGAGQPGAREETTPTVPVKATEVLPYQDPALPFDQRVADLVGRMTLAEKASEMQMSILPGADSPEVQRLGIPPMHWWSEAIHGMARAGKATVFPQAIALAASWDPALLQQVADVTATEARAKYVPGQASYGLTLWAPTINMARDPRWGRVEETYGEDPYLTGRLAVAFVKGLQGDDPKYLKTAATPKHFAMHSQETQRMSRSFDCPEAVLRDYYLPAFRDAFQEGKAASTMAAFSGINQVPDTANFWLLTSLLRREWGFEGAVVTDFGGVTQLLRQQKYMTTLPQAVAAAINAGVDVTSEGDHKGMQNAIIDAVNGRLLKREVLDRAVARNLMVRFRLGMFDPPELVAYQKIAKSEVGTKEHQALALQAALESMVLLKNDALPSGRPFRKLLPLDVPHINSIAVLGTYADHNYYGAYSGTPANPAPTLTAALREAVGDRIRIHTEAGTDRERNVKAAQDSDVVIFTCGLSGAIEREGTDRSSILLPSDQQALLNEVVKANPRTLVLLVCGSPVSLETIKDKVPAILLTWYAGEQGAVAASMLLLGQANPSGKLPVTFYAANEDLPPLDEYDIRQGRTYMYLRKPVSGAFGEGRSYTTYEYRNFRVTPDTVPTNGTVTASLEVANTGAMDGAEVVQLYVRVKDAGSDRPIKRLTGFQRVTIPAGQVRNVTFTTPLANLGFWDVGTKNYVPEKGVYEFLVGASSADIRGKAEVTVK